MSKSELWKEQTGCRLGNVFSNYNNNNNNNNNRRGVRRIKFFICFCLYSYDLHLEIVNDLTNETFLAFLWRFTSGRRILQEMIKCGVNSVGAEKILGKLTSKYNTKWNN